MKKILILSVIFVLALTALVGCGKGDKNDNNIYSVASFDNESKIVPADESKEESSEETPLTGEFAVKDKKYSFDGNDLVVLSVENQTNKNYSVTVTGTYLDADGKALKTETQTFEEYSAGYSGYFLFEPKMTFASFTYEFEAKESEGPFYAKDVSFKFNGLEKTRNYIQDRVSQKDYTMYPCIDASFSYANASTLPLMPTVQWILVDENDTVIAIIHREPLLDVGQGFDQYYNWVLHYTMEDDIEWPEGWDGEIRAIPVVQSLLVDPIISVPPAA